MLVEHKSVPVGGVEVVDEEKGIVDAWVSVTGIVDEVKDIIEPGAYAKTLAKRKPKGVWSHSWTDPISKTLEVEELMPGDPRLPKADGETGRAWPKEAGALLVKMQFNLKTSRGRDAFEDVKFFGPEQQWSIGYNVPAGGAIVERKTGVRRIQTLDLFEFSPVLFGAMPLAATSSVKSAQAAYRAAVGTLVEHKDGALDDVVVEGNVVEEVEPEPEPEAEAEAEVEVEVEESEEAEDYGQAEFEADVEDGFTDEELNEEVADDEAAAILALVQAEDIGLTEEETKALQELAGFEVKAEGGVDKNRGGAEKLRHYWTRGAGAAKIAWGTPGDWRRCVAQLTKYLGPRAKGYCNLRHKEMNGFYPGDDRNKGLEDELDLEEKDLIVLGAVDETLEAIEARLDGELDVELKDLLREALSAVDDVMSVIEEKGLFRRVRTHEGSRRFGRPIGSLIDGASVNALSGAPGLRDNPRPAAVADADAPKGDPIPGRGFRVGDEVIDNDPETPLGQRQVYVIVDYDRDAKNGVPHLVIRHSDGYEERADQTTVRRRPTGKGLEDDLEVETKGLAITAEDLALLEELRAFTD